MNMTRGKLVHVFRRPRYPVLCAVPGDLIVAYSLQQLEHRVAKVEVPADDVLNIIDATGEGWALHTAMDAVSPMTLKKNWTKMELLNLYRESATGRRVGLPLEDKVLIRRRLDAVISFIAELLRTGGPNKPVQPTRAPEPNGKQGAARRGSDPRIEHLRVTEDEIIAQLVDGRVISVPLAWSWRLAEATPEQRANFRLIGTGQGVHWPDVDEDISVEGMLHGTPARRPAPGRPATGPRASHHEAPNKRMRPTRKRGARGTGPPNPG